MKILEFIFVALIVSISCYCIGSPTDKEVSTYQIIEKGDKKTFEQIDRNDLGKVCTVYMKSGYPSKMIGTVCLTSLALQKDSKTGLNCWVGELHALTKDGVRLRWINSEKSSCSEYGAIGSEIEYIIFKPVKSRL